MFPCPQCGASVSETQAFCTNCGYALHSAEQNPETPNAPPVPLYQPVQPQVPPSYFPPPGQGYYPPSQQMLPTGQPYAPSQPYPGGYPPPSVPRTPSVILPSVFGVSADPTSVQPQTKIQQVMVRNLPGVATNPIVGALVGAIAAVIGCFVLLFITQLIFGPILNPVFNPNGAATSGISALTGNVMNYIALAHGATIVDTTSQVGSATFATTLTLPINFLLLLPAVALVLGGWISAATDYSNRVRYVLGRAAAVGPLYGIILTLLTLLFGTQTVTQASGGTPFTDTVGPSWSTMLLYTVLWGIVFSALGGFVKLFGARWRAGAVSFVTSIRHSLVAAGALGALAGVGLGIALALPVVLFFFGGANANEQFATALLGTNDTSLLAVQNANRLLYFLVLLPGAICALAFGSGAPTNLTNFSSLGTIAVPNGDVSIFSKIIPHPVLLLLLLPAIAYFFGGRVAARLVGGTDRNQQIVAGALAGLGSALLMFGLVYISGIYETESGSGQNFTGAFGISAGGAFLATLVASGVMSILGAASYHLPQPRQVAPRADIFTPLDRLTRMPAGVRRPLARTLLYSAISAIVFFAVVTIVFDILSRTLVIGLTFTRFTTALGIWSGLVLGVPALLLLLALAADLVSVPEDSGQLLQHLALPSPDPSQAAPYPFAPPTGTPFAAPTGTPFAPPIGTPFAPSPSMPPASMPYMAPASSPYGLPATPSVPDVAPADTPPIRYTPSAPKAPPILSDVAEAPPADASDAPPPADA